MGDEALGLVSIVVEKNIKLLCDIYCSFAGKSIIILTYYRSALLSSGSDISSQS